MTKLMMRGHTLGTTSKEEWLTCIMATSYKGPILEKHVQSLEIKTHQNNFEEENVL